MKKRTTKKLTLNRETLVYLDGVVGSGTLVCHPGETGTDGPTIFTTCGAGSQGCATGGACTVTCSVCTNASCELFCR
jgi:hypothetical protein